jgi:hypothetical protein
LEGLSRLGYSAASLRRARGLGAVEVVATALLR